jgi:hypothetical protein
VFFVRVTECFGKRVLPDTIDITRPEERDKLNRIGSEIAAQEGLHYEGYTAITVEPYSIKQAKAILYFD